MQRNVFGVVFYLQYIIIHLRQQEKRLKVHVIRFVFFRKNEEQADRCYTEGSLFIYLFFFLPAQWINVKLRVSRANILRDPSWNILKLIYDSVGSPWKIMKNRDGQLPSIFVTHNSASRLRINPTARWTRRDT